MTTHAPAPRAARRGLRAAPWLLWFAVLGGAVAWSVHTVAAWAVDELVCRSGHDEVAGVPLRTALLVVTLSQLAVALAAVAVAWVLRARLSGASSADPLEQLRLRRASFMAAFGLVADVLFAGIIVLGLAAVLVLPVCQA